jgi:hypothetical protein
MFSVTNVTSNPMTPELAREFAQMPGLPGERPLNPVRLKHLDTERRTGRFTSPTWAVVINEATGQRYRANGQHSSTMLSSQCPPEEFPTGLRAIVVEYTTDNFAEDAFTIFEIFDNPRSVRNNTDKMSQFRALYPDLAHIKLQILVAVANGIYHYEDQREGGITLGARVRGIYYNQPEVREFAQWITAYDNTMHDWMITKPGLVCAMFATIKADKANAEVFWDYTFLESHGDPEHESRELTRNLKELLPRRRIGQDRLQKEASKFWRRYTRSIPAATAA